MKSTELTPKVCDSDKDRTDDEDDESMEDLPGLQDPYNISDNDNPKSSKTKQNSMSINQRAAAASNKKTQNRNIYKSNQPINCKTNGIKRKRS